MLTTLLICILTSSPTGKGAFAPNLVEDNGSAWMTWIEPANKEKDINALKCAKFEDGVWCDANLVVQGNNFFANWADFPELGVAKDGSLFVTWPQQSGPGAYAYDIAVARSDDDGKTWSLMGVLNDDRVLGEHGFVSLVPEGENGVRAFWLDGRAMSGDGHMGEGGGDMQLRTAIINDKVQKSELLDTRVCECCGTDAVVAEDEAVVIYRDRSDAEIRDISVTAIGREPMNFFADNWNIEGCPVNGPSLDVFEDTVAAAWYTAAEDNPAVYVAFSSDPIKISDSILGRVDLVVTEKNKATVVWLEPKGEKAVVMLATVRKDGTIQNKTEVAEVSGSRASGFPRIAKLKEGVLVAWTDLDRDKGISTKFYPN
jgi:hypothetical protein